MRPLPRFGPDVSGSDADPAPLARWLSNTADADFRSIVLWSEARFGPEHARIYAEALRATFACLAGRPLRRLEQDFGLKLPKAFIRCTSHEFVVVLVTLFSSVLLATGRSRLPAFCTTGWTFDDTCRWTRQERLDAIEAIVSAALNEA